MYYEIVKDFFLGMIDSCKIFLLLNKIRNNITLKSSIFKIIKYNLLLYILPELLAMAIMYFIGISIYGFLNIIRYPINIASALFHILLYMDVVNIISVNVARNSNSIPMLDLISWGITTLIYQLVIFLTTEIIDIVFSNSLYHLAFIFNFICLSIYHSFYCYNNLWQYRKILISNRIDMHEKLWPYYTGYGTISTFMYLNNNRQYVVGLYNMYTVLAITLPFMLKVKYPKKENEYPPINLKIFSYITKCIIDLSMYITKS